MTAPGAQLNHHVIERRKCSKERRDRHKQLPSPCTEACVVRQCRCHTPRQIDEDKRKENRLGSQRPDGGTSNREDERDEVCL